MKKATVRKKTVVPERAGPIRPPSDAAPFKSLRLHVNDMNEVVHTTPEGTEILIATLREDLKFDDTDEIETARRIAHLFAASVKLYGACYSTLAREPQAIELLLNATCAAEDF